MPKSPRKEFSATLRLEITCEPRPRTCRAKYILASSSDTDLDGWRAVLRRLAGHADCAPGVGTAPHAGHTDQPRPLLDGDRERCVQMALVCARASRYDDMTAHVMKLAAARAELSTREEDLMSEAFARVAWERRSTWRSLCAAEYAQEHATRGRFADRASALRREAEEALKVHCCQVITNLEGLIPSASRPVSRILYLLLLADHHRYMAEVTRGGGRLTHTKHSLTTYQAAAATAAPAISASHTVALRLALGHATLIAEVLGDCARGAAMARQAFDKALDVESAGTATSVEAYDGLTGVESLEHRMGAMQLLITAADKWSAAAEELSDGSGDSGDERG